MSKFNVPTGIKEQLESNPNATANYEGGLSFKLDPLTKLYVQSASSMMKAKYYESEQVTDAELLDSIKKAIAVDPEFVLQLAVYCRENMYLRSVPLMLVAEFANSPAVGKVSNARKYVTRVIQRADELTELVAYQLARNKVVPRKNANAMLPMMLKYGIADAFEKFDEYQFGKYVKYNETGTVKFRDVLFLTRPSPANSERKELYNKIAENELETPVTWEVMHTTGKMTWHEVIHNIFYKNKKVNNYMAILRNIRNILTDNSITKDDILLYARMLSDRNAVIHSKQFPYRFLSAYIVTQYVDSPYRNVIINSLEEAIKYSTEALPKLNGLTVIASDFSGSMNDIIGQRPTKKRLTYEQEQERRKYAIHRCDIGQLLGMIANQFCEATLTGIFGDTWAVLPISKYSGILQTTIDMRNKAGHLVGCSTNGYLVPQYLLQNNIEVDRMFIFTDEQMWDSSGYNKSFAVEFLKYQRKYPNVKLYLFDLAGYGDMVVPQDTKNVCLISGWSDKVFDFVAASEEAGKPTVIQTIKSIKP